MRSRWPSGSAFLEWCSSARRLRPDGAAEAERLMAALADATRDARAEAERLTAAREQAEAAAARASRGDRVAAPGRGGAAPPSHP